MNKLLKSLVLLFVLLALVFGLSACKEQPTEQEHVHMKRYALRLGSSLF